MANLQSTTITVAGGNNLTLEKPGGGALNFTKSGTNSVLFEDDVELTRTFHRHVLSQGDDITNEDEKVIAIANAIWI
jgi:hypothetical protein